MSKRVLIVFAVGFLAIIAGILLLKFELTKTDAYRDPNEEEKNNTDTEEVTEVVMSADKSVKTELKNESGSTEN